MTSAAAPETTSVSPKRRSRLFRVVRALGIAAAVVLVLAGVAALWLPGYLTDLAVREIRDQLHREASIAHIGINPLTLSAHVEGFAVKDADGQSPLLAFESLRTRVGIMSLFRGAPVIEALAVDKPEIHLARVSAERYNISDILDTLLAGPPNPSGPRFALSSLAVNDAVIVFDDRPVGKVHRVEKLNVRLPALSAFEDDRDRFAEPSLTAIVNGEPLALTGRTKPFAESLETVLEVKLEDLDLPRYLGYSPVALPLRLESGKLSTALEVSVVRAKDKHVTVAVKGALSIADLLLRDPRTSMKVASTQRIDVAIGKLEWPANTLALDRLAVTGPQVYVRREKDGTLNWQTLLAQSAKPASDAPAAPSDAAPFRFAIADAEIADGLVLLEDAAAPGGDVRVVVSPIAVHARNVSNAEGVEAALGASLVTDGGERITHEGTMTLQPFAAKGRISAAAVRLARYRSYLADVIDADVDGTLEAESSYVLSPDGALSLAGARVGAANLVLQDRKRSEIARIASLALDGIGLDLAKHAVNVGAVALKSCRAAIVRERDGRLNAMSIVRTTTNAAPAPVRNAAPVVTAPARNAAPVPTAPAPQTASAASAPWSVAVAQVSVERCALMLDDRAATAEAAARITVDPLDLRIENWSLAADNRARVDLRATINGRGKLAVKGTAGGTPLAANLDVALDALELVPFQPYVADRLNVRVTSGAVSSHGKLAVTGGAATAMRYRGGVSLADLASATKADGEDFLNWSSLRATGLDVAVNGGGAAPVAVTIDEVALAGFYSRLIVNSDGTLNVQHVVRDVGAGGVASAEAAAGRTEPAAKGASRAGASPAASGAAAAPPAASAAAAASPASSTSASATPPSTTSAAPTPITIARVVLASGRINFSDHFIKPNYSADIVDVNGTIAGLSSDPAARATVDVHGRYDPSAPVEIKGTINPLSGNLFLDIAASCRDVELVQFTPYAQKYAGYGITKGKLMLNVKYTIDNRKLTADNTLLLQQLTFGERVESPDATKLPVLLAVSLLKNANGDIDLNLPISGSLDDPEFSVFGIVLKIIGNLLVKAATSPFTLLAALTGGGGEDLAFVDFPAGAAVPPAAQQDKLAKIAKALADRPGLRLDIAGRVDPAADREALQRRALLRKLVSERRPGAAVPDVPTAGTTARPATTASTATAASTSTSAPAATEPNATAAPSAAAAPTAADAQLTSTAQTMPAAAEAITIPPQELAGLLKRVYDREVAKPPAAGTTAPEVPPAEMERALLASIAVSDDDLSELAERRANAAKNALSALGVAGERMYIVAAPAGGDSKPAPRVDFVLK